MSQALEYVGYERTAAEEIEQLPDIADAKRKLGDDVTSRLVRCPYAELAHTDNPSIILGDR